MFDALSERLRRTLGALTGRGRVTEADVDSAMRDGIDIRGFFHWTGVDNYEWGFGYNASFGLFTRDRKPRGSASLLARFANA